MKIGIVGHFGTGKNLTNGQTVKTKNLYEELKKIYDYENIFIVDTHNWKKNPLRLLINCFLVLKKCKNVIILPAQNGVKFFVPLFSYLNVIFKRKIHYVVIGSWLYNLLLNNKRIISRIKKISYIYVENNNVKNKLADLSIKNVFVMKNFKNIEPIKENEIKKTNIKQIKTCIFSRIIIEKGIEEAIDCIKQLSANYKKRKIELDIYGPIDSEYEERFNKIQKEFPKNIKYMGIVDSNKSVNVLKNYDLLLFPTKYFTEGIPGTIIDAYASGVPVIASNWENAKEIIDDGKTGVIFEFYDIKDFYLKIIEILDNEEKINSMKKNALEKFNEFIPNKVLKVLIDNLD